MAVLCNPNFDLGFYLLPQIPVFSFCKSLRILKLGGCRFEGNVGMDDDGIILPFLNELHIKYCLIPHHNFVSTLLHGCPQLVKFSHKFNFPGDRTHLHFSSNIKHLVIASFYAIRVSDIIVAPNLQTFKISGLHHRENCKPWYYNANFSKPHLTMCAPNLEAFSFKNVSLDNEDIMMVSSTFKNLKELEFHGCCFKDEIKFDNEKIERLTISNCVFIS